MTRFSRTEAGAIAFAAAAMLASCSDRGNLQSEFQSRSVTVAGRSYEFRVFVPKNRRLDEKIPVILFLHGSGARGDDNSAQVVRIEAAMPQDHEKFGFIIVAPQCRADTFWGAQETADYALAAVDQSVKEFNGDPKRLYLIGFSLGGYGVWQIAAGNPGKFAALVPVAGGIVEHPIKPPGRAAIIPSVGEMLDSPEPYKAVAKAIGQTPVWIFHGAMDRDVPVQFSRNIVEALTAEGRTDVRYTEYPDDKHQIFDKAFSEPGILQWLSDQRLEPDR